MTMDDEAIDTQLELKRAEEKSELKRKVRFHLFPKPGGADCRVPDCSDSNDIEPTEWVIADRGEAGEEVGQAGGLGER